MNAPAAIDVSGLHKAFAGQPVLRGIDLRVEPGELTGLVGPNGAGKTTLLRALVGLCAGDGGRVAVCGHDPATDPVAVRTHACYLPGETSVYQQMTGGEFLEFALSFYRHRRTALLERLAAGFALPLTRRIRGYSAGMKQKLALLATLGADVDLYLLDEPDRALDANARLLLREVVQSLAQDGKTVLLSSHHLAEVENLAHRIVFLLAGRVVPTAVCDAARERLRARLRVRLRPGASLPAGCVPNGRDPDGAYLFEGAAATPAVLQAVPPTDLLDAELGKVRLEELYQLLLAAVPAEAP